MARRLIRNEPDAGHWIASKCSVPYHPTTDYCIAVEKNGELVGGVLITQWTGRGGSCTLHVGSDETGYWATKAFVKEVFWTIFDWLGCNKVFGQVPTTCPPNVLAFNEHLGFVYEHTIKDTYPDGDMILLAMYKRDCKFLDIRPGGHLFG